MDEQKDDSGTVFEYIFESSFGNCVEDCVVFLYLFHFEPCFPYMGVSKNNGTNPKSSMFTIHFGGKKTLIFGNIKGTMKGWLDQTAEVLVYNSSCVMWIELQDL